MNPDKMNRDKHTEKDRRSYKQSSRIDEGRWANRSSGSDNEDRENEEAKRAAEEKAAKALKEKQEALDRAKAAEEARIEAERKA